MDKKSKIFFIVMGLFIAGSVFATYYRMMISKNYIIEAQTDCDPYTQRCFIWRCDPNSTAEGEACTGNVEKDIWYYNLVERNASKIPLCDPSDENCKALECLENEADCKYIYCNAETKIAQKAECSDPEEYIKENPPVDETVTDSSKQECASDDEECANTVDTGQE